MNLIRKLFFFNQLYGYPKLKFCFSGFNSSNKNIDHRIILIIQKWKQSKSCENMKIKN